MKIAILLLSLWAITATTASPVIKAAVPPPPGAPPPVAGAPAPAAATTPAAPVVAPADLVATKYKVSFKLANVQYTEELASYDSAVYQNYAGKILTALMNLYADDDAYREVQMIGFRNDTGVVADVQLRFGNDSKNLASLAALVATGNLGGSLPVDPASLKAVKDESVPPIAGCPPPCGAPTSCYPQCGQDCCGGSSAAAPYMPQVNQQYGAPMPMGGMQMGGGPQCAGACPSSCAPSCEQSCCGGGNAGGMSPVQVG